MDGKIANTMMRMLALALKSGEALQISELSDEDATALYGLSKSHDLAHIIGTVLAKSGAQIPLECVAKFKKQQQLATYRFLGMHAELEQICAALEMAQIPFMPLKGSVIRDYYPNPEMRTSSDIDILVHPEDLERAMCVFRDTLQYDVGNKNVYDVSMFSPGGVHVELHFSLAEDDPDLDAVLLTAWDTATTNPNTEFCYRMSDEMFYVYTVAHMAKHFLHGGCGIRPFMDLWIIEHKIGYDSKKADALLYACRLTKFAQQAKALTEVWFGKQEHTALTKDMETYILGGGVYGISENKIAIASTRSGSRLRYALGRIFLPNSKLKLAYPILEKYPVLYPFYLVKRWFRILLGKDRKGAIRELKQTATVGKTKKAHLSSLCKDLELI